MFLAWCAFSLKQITILLCCNFRIAFVIIVPAFTVHIVDHTYREQIKVTDRNTQLYAAQEV